jgi:hypothetical protein
MDHARRHAAGLLAALLPVPVLVTAMAGAEPQVTKAEPIQQSASGAAIVPMPLLVEAVSGWVAADLGLPMPDTPPSIVFVDPEAMAAVRRDQQGWDGGRAQSTGGPVAFYNLRTGAIHLPADWTGASPVELSILVHEIVHHFQATSGQRFACPAEREGDAFDSQERWLARFGETLEGAFGIEPLARLVLTRCMF